MIFLRRFKIFSFVLLILLLNSCATNINLNSKIDELTLMNIKLHLDKPVSFIYKNNINDGLIKPYRKDKIEQMPIHVGYYISESTVLRKMLTEYLSTKYISITQDSDLKIIVTLKDFWIEQYNINSAEQQVATALLGGNTSYMCVAKIQVEIIVNKKGEIYKKNILVTSDDVYSHIIGQVPTYDNSFETTHSKNINDANKKVIILFNSFLDEIGI